MKNPRILHLDPNALIVCIVNVARIDLFYQDVNKPSQRSSAGIKSKSFTMNPNRWLQNHIGYPLILFAKSGMLAIEWKMKLQQINKKQLNQLITPKFKS